MVKSSESFGINAGAVWDNANGRAGHWLFETALGPLALVLATVLGTRPAKVKAESRARTTPGSGRMTFSVGFREGVPGWPTGPRESFFSSLFMLDLSPVQLAL